MKLFKLLVALGVAFCHAHEEQMLSLEDRALEESRLQSMIIAEKYLEQSADSNCMQEMVCQVASSDELANNHEKKAIYSTISMLDGIMAKIKPETRAAFPVVKKMMLAFRVGDRSRDANICRWLFPCYSRGDLGRSACSASKALCPGLAIGCGLCGILAPSVCSSICPVAGLYCGSSAYICSSQPQPSTTTAPVSSTSTTLASTTTAPTTTSTLTTTTTTMTSTSESPSTTPQAKTEYLATFAGSSFPQAMTIEEADPALIVSPRGSSVYSQGFHNEQEEEQAPPSIAKPKMRFSKPEVRDDDDTLFPLFLQL